MTECIHELNAEQCSVCAAKSSIAHEGGASTMAGKSFALIYAPAIRRDTFLHLNREGDHWKIRWYSSPSRPATEVAQSALASRRQVLDLASVEIIHEVAYPYSTSPSGVTVRDSRYWFDEIERTNAEHGISSKAP
jgi:hypothetical protein